MMGLNGYTVKFFGSRGLIEIMGRADTLLKQRQTMLTRARVMPADGLGAPGLEPALKRYCKGCNRSNLQAEKAARRSAKPVAVFAFSFMMRDGFIPALMLEGGRCWQLPDQVQTTTHGKPSCVNGTSLISGLSLLAGVLSGAWLSAWWLGRNKVRSKPSWLCLCRACDRYGVVRWSARLGSDCMGLAQASQGALKPKR